MASKQTIGHKRARSLVDSESGDPKPDAPQATPPIRAILIHLSALLSSDEAVTHTVRTVLSELLEEDEIPEMSDEDILRAFTTSSRIHDIVRELGVRKLTNEEINRMESLYRIEYFAEGWPRLCLDPHAKAFIEEAIRQRPHLRLAAISNNPPKAWELFGKLGVKEFETVLNTTAVTTATEGSQAYEAFWDNWKDNIASWFDDPYSWIGWDSTDYRKVGGASIDEDTMDKDVVDTNVDHNTTGKAATSKEHDANPDSSSDQPQATSKETASEDTNMNIHATTNNNNPNDTTNDTPNDTTNEATNDPTAPCNFNNYHAPNPFSPPLQPSEVLVISCALYDLGIAKFTGMQTCWLRRIKPDDAVTHSVAGNFDIVASDLDEVRVKLFGGDNKNMTGKVDCKWVEKAEVNEEVKAEGKVILGAGDQKSQGHGQAMHGAGELEAQAVLVSTGAVEKQDQVMEAAGNEKGQVVQASAEDNQAVHMEVCDD